MTKKRFLALLMLIGILVSWLFSYMAYISETEIAVMVWGTMAALGWTVVAIGAISWVTIASMAYYERLPR
jgi:hypothetical protein